jgi:hypothetical protein
MTENDITAVLNARRPSTSKEVMISLLNFHESLSYDRCMKAFNDLKTIRGKPSNVIKPSDVLAPDWIIYISNDCMVDCMVDCRPMVIDVITANKEEPLTPDVFYDMMFEIHVQCMIEIRKALRENNIDQHQNLTFDLQ